jgi:hypothetical protein
MPKSFGQIAVSRDSFARPTGTTQYTAGDAVSPAALVITAASNATPIVVTSVAHGLSTGDAVTVASVGGNTNANADWIVTVIDDDTFSLDGSVGNSAYTSGGTATRLLRLQNVARRNYTQGKIVKTRLICNLATITSGTFRVYFFTEQIPQIADNAAWTYLYANLLKTIGFSAVLTLATGGAGSDGAEGIDATSVIPFDLVGGETQLFAVIVATGTYTPATAELFTLEITVEYL